MRAWLLSVLVVAVSPVTAEELAVPVREEVGYMGGSSGCCVGMELRERLPIGLRLAG